MLMRRLIASILALVLATYSQPALAWLPHGTVAVITVPNVTPGGQQPSVNTSTRVVTATYNTITPSNHGTPGDTGYAIRGLVRWDDIPLIEVGTPGVSTTRHIGFIPAHTPTDTEFVAGLDSNISSAKVRCDSTDGAHWFTISAPSTNPDADGVTDWNFAVTNASFPDGLHKCDLLISPATGPDIIADGPLTDQYANGLENPKADAVMISDGTGLVAGNVMTVTPVVISSNDTTIRNWTGAATSAAAVSVGQSVGMYGAAPNTFVTATHAENATYTGTGRGGTYLVSGAPALTAAATMTGSISGVNLTITATPTNAVQISQAIYGSGVSANTLVIASADFNAGTCTPSCTGHGGTGTYGLSVSQTVASTTLNASAPAVFSTARSFYFLTNYGGTLSRPAVFVSLAGNDSTGSGTAASPYLTTGKAIGVIAATTGGGLYGGTVCLENGSSYVYSGAGSPPWGTDGWLTYRSAKAGDAICPHAGDPGGATITNDLSSRSQFAAHTMWQNLNFIGPANDQSAGSGQYLAAQNVSQTHDTIGNGGVLSSGAAYCTGSTSWFGTDGICSSSLLTRANTGKYYFADGQHDVAMLVSNTFDYGGPRFNWALGNSTIGSPTITGITLPAELSGYTLTSIFGGGFQLDFAQAGTNLTSCFSGAALNVVSINDGAKSITLSANASANCTGGFLVAPGAHGDMWQLQIGNPEADVIAVNNSWGAVSPGFQQGEFLEMPQISGGYIAGNFWASDTNTTESIVNVKGGNENLINSRNTYNTNKPMEFGLQQASRGYALTQDACPNGTSYAMTVTGTGLRRKAASSNACYVNLP